MQKPWYTSSTWESLDNRVIVPNSSNNLRIQRISESQIWIEVSIWSTYIWISNPSFEVVKRELVHWIWYVWVCSLSNFSLEIQDLILRELRIQICVVSIYIVLQGEIIIDLCVKILCHKVRHYIDILDGSFNKRLVRFTSLVVSISVISSLITWRYIEIIGSHCFWGQASFKGEISCIHAVVVLG